MEKYQQIKEYLRKKALEPESRYRMPTVQELKQLFGVSQAPVSRAIRDLSEEGIVKCRRGSGMVSCGVQPSVESVVIPRAEEKESVLFICTNYFSESIWKMKHTVMAYSALLHFNFVDCPFEKNDDLPKLIAAYTRSLKIKGLILSSGSGRLDRKVLDFLGSLACPVVMVNSNFFYENLAGNITILSLDSAEGGRLCVEELHRAGHRKIAYIRNEPEDDLTLMRKKAILANGAAYGMEVHYFSSTIKPWEDTVKYSAEITRNKINEIREKEITALIYYSGMGALAGMRELLTSGIRIPEDISIVAESDNRMLALYYPSVTAIVGENLDACQDAMDIIAGKTVSPGLRLYPYRLIPRESVANRCAPGSPCEDTERSARLTV